MSFRTVQNKNQPTHNHIEPRSTSNLQGTRSLAQLSQKKAEKPKFLSPMLNTQGKENYSQQAPISKPKPPRTPILSSRSSMIQKETVIGIIKEETESEIANYASNSKKGSYLRFNSNSVCRTRDLNSSDERSLSRFDELDVDETIAKNEYCALLKKTVKEIYLEKKKDLEEEFKKKEVYFLGIISELKMKNCDLLESKGEETKNLRQEIEIEEKIKYERFKREFKEKTRKEIEEEFEGKVEKFKTENFEKIKGEVEEDLKKKYEKIQKECHEKYDDLEEKLKRKFAKDSKIFVESIQKEMHDILESKGLSKSRRRELEEEYFNSLKESGKEENDEKLREKIEEEIREKVEKEFEKSKEEEMEQIKEIVKTQLKKKRQFLEESNNKILDQKIKQKYEKLQIKFEEEKKILELKLEKERFELEKKRKLLELKLSCQMESNRPSRSQPQTTRERFSSKEPIIDEEKIKKKYKKNFEKKEKKYKKIINQLSLKMGQIQERVKKYFKQVEESKKKEDMIEMLRQKEILLTKREKDLEEKIEEFKIFNQSALMYSDITCSQISQISAISKRKLKEEDIFKEKENGKKKKKVTFNGEKQEEENIFVDLNEYETGNFGEDRKSMTPNIRTAEKVNLRERGAHSLEKTKNMKEDLNQGIIEIKEEKEWMSKNSNNGTNHFSKKSKTQISVEKKNPEPEVKNQIIDGFNPPKPKQVKSTKDIREIYKHAISAKNPYLQNPANSPLRPPLSPSPPPRRASRKASAQKHVSIAPEISYINKDSFILQPNSRRSYYSPSPCRSAKYSSGERTGKRILIKSDRKSINLLKSIFLVNEKDDANTVSLKRLRQHINQLREKDAKFKVSYEDKLNKLQSKSYLVAILEKCKKLIRTEYIQEIEHIQSKMQELENLWNTLFTGYEQRLYLLTKIMSSRDENSDDFLLRLKTNISLEIDFLTDKMNSKKYMLELLNQREKVKVKIYQTSRRYKEQFELKDLVGELKGFLSTLKNLNLRILGEIEKMKKVGVKESELKVYGIKFELLARIDIWEEDYMRKVADGKL